MGKWSTFLPFPSLYMFLNNWLILRAGAGLICITHRYKPVPNQYLRKPYRLLVRVAIALTILLLPLAKSLNSLDLIATTMGLVVLVLLCELGGATSVN
jgi:hypothetical protein